MRIVTVGIVQNETAGLLLIQRNDGRVWVPPSGGLEYGESLSAGVRREVFEETGLWVQPTELTQVYFWPQYPNGTLQFVFRCQIEGGKLTPSAESPQVGFFRWANLPKPIWAYHQGVLRRALRHQGPGPAWGIAQHPSWMRAMFGVRDRWATPLLEAWQRRQGRYQAGPNWRVTASVMVQRGDGAVLWLADPISGERSLPSGNSRPLEPPWVTARRVGAAASGLNIALSGLLQAETDSARGLRVLFSGQLLPNKPQTPASQSNLNTAQLGKFYL